MPRTRSHPDRAPAAPASTGELLRGATPGAGSTRSFLIAFAVAFALLLGTVTAYNVYVDPLSVTGAHHFAERSPEPSFRSIKAALIGRLDTAPDVLVLGSSSTERIDPVVVQRVAGRSSFNASVTNGTPVDGYTLARYTAERFPTTFPHLVYGIDVHRVLDPSVVLSPANLTMPALRRQLTGLEAMRLRAHMLQPYTTWETTKLSWETMRSDLPSADVAGFRFTAAGYLRKDPYRFRKRAPYIAEQVDYYDRMLYGNGSYRERGSFSRYYMERTLRLANEHGDAPTIFLAPVHPDFRAGVADLGWNKQRRIVRDWLDDLRRDEGLRFDVLDLTDPATFDGDPARFDDHVHMDAENLTRLVRHLDGRGAFDAHNARADD